MFQYFTFYRQQRRSEQKRRQRQDLSPDQKRRLRQDLGLGPAQKRWKRQDLVQDQKRRRTRDDGIWRYGDANLNCFLAFCKKEKIRFSFVPENMSEKWNFISPSFLVPKRMSEKWIFAFPTMFWIKLIWTIATFRPSVRKNLNRKRG